MSESALTPFALAFMLVSMVSVTSLMLYCLTRILKGGPAGDDSGSAE
ncbi:MAG: hypothetical protein ACE5JR_05940 [Gemmatimonadota bacterium]